MRYSALKKGGGGGGGGGGQLIPNIIHFVFGLAPDFGGKPFSLVHCLAVKSAIVVNRPDQVYFHCAYEPATPLWRSIRPELTVSRVDPPTEIFGRPISRVEHRADVVRLQVLSHYGGIYLDLDTICVKPLTALLAHECVIGREETRGTKVKGLCNAVILAASGSRFVRRWLQSYRTFNPDYYHTHSVVVPRLLAQDAEAGEVHIEPATSFHFPSWSEEELTMLFEQSHHFPAAYVHHLWASRSWERYLRTLTPEHIRSEDSTYNRLARRYVPDIPIP